MFHTAVKQAACAAEDELGNKIRRPARRLTQRNSHPQKIFRVHIKWNLFNVWIIRVKKANCFAIHKFDNHSQRLARTDVA